MQPKQHGLSLIIACYNEEPHLLSSYERLVKKLKKCKIPYEIIFVDDKSKDNTGKIIKSIVAKDKLTSAIFHKKNIGRGGSVTDGMLKAKYKYAGFVDIDLEISEIYIDLFIDELNKGNDVAIALRTYVFKLRSLHRIIISKCYVYLEKFLLNSPFSDTEAGCKFFNKEKILPILKKVKDKGWFWDTEIVIRSYLNGLLIKEIPVRFVRRKGKKSTVHIINDSFYYFKKLLNFKKEVNLRSLPTVSMLLYYKISLKNLIVALLKYILFPLKEIDKILPQKGLILDIGCAEGVVSNFLSLSNPCRKVVGIDLCRQKINIANKTINGRHNISFLKKDILDFDFPKCQAVVASDFLHHLNSNDQNNVLKKVFKSLGGNGILLIKEVDNESGIRKCLSRFWDFVFYPGDKIIYKGEGQWKTDLQKMGFAVNLKQTSPLSPFSTILITARKI